MTDDRARRIREIRNRTSSTADEEEDDTEVGGEAEQSNASDAASESQSESSSRDDADEAGHDGGSTTQEQEQGRERERERAQARDQESAADDSSAEDDEAAGGETVSYDEAEVVAAGEPVDESGSADDSGSETEPEPTPAADAGGNAGGGTLGGAVSTTGGGSDGAIEASLRGAIAGMSETVTVDERVGEATVDATALGQRSDAYGEAAAGREQVFDRGDSLIASTHNEEDTVQMLEFFLNENRYAIEIERISAIVEMKEITRFPRGPDAIDGVTDLRGEITGVLDPTVMLDVERSEPSDDHYIVVLERDGDKQKLGIRVTDVLQAVTYRESQIDETGSVMDDGGANHEFVDGIVKKETDDGTALVAWLDVDELIENTEMGHRPGERLGEQSA